MVEQVNTPSEIIDALGGNSKLAPLVGLKPNAIGNWRVKGIPARYYLRLSELLSKRGLTAPPKVFGMLD